jgi:hypothetical protein
LFLNCSSETMHTPGPSDLRTPTPGGPAGILPWPRRRVYCSLCPILCSPPPAFCFLLSVLRPLSPVINRPGALPAERPGALPGERVGCLFCKKTTSGRIFMSTNGLNNEEALEENMGAGRGCLFLCCSSKQTTNRGGVKPLSVFSTTRVVETSRGCSQFSILYSHPYRVDHP